MNINSLSFGKKIPINQVRVLDKQQNKFVDATFYEYDCMDLYDIADVSKLDKTWSFGSVFSSAMHLKYMWNFMQRGEQHLHYYCLKNEKDETIGLCATEEKEDDITVKFLESKPDASFKYCGQTMLSSLAEKILKTRMDKLKIQGALMDVLDFYKNVCGFKPMVSSSKGHLPAASFEMSNEELPAFIKRTKDKTEQV